MPVSRRKFLNLSAGSIAGASLGGISTALSGIQAQAGNTSGYKAMVCVFLFGGMDNHDTIIPYDQGSYQRWANIRSSLIRAQGASRARDNLLQLSNEKKLGFGSRKFALPPELAGLHRLYETGNAAVIGNVGPLLTRTDRSSFTNELVPLPSRLFSHNDQQATWMAGAPEGAQFGWGGLFADAMQQSGANLGAAFSTVTTGGSALFITGRETAPYQVGEEGASQPWVLEYTEEKLRDELRRHFRAERYNRGNFLRRDMASKVHASFDANELYNIATQKIDASNETPFPSTPLGQQLRSVARTIAARAHLGVHRQIFTVAMGGFDTHSGQAQDLPALQTALGDAIEAFYGAIDGMGLANDVTLFTASDFGRTLAINGDGTDHGWGAHHFVVGGAVKGKQIFGDIPEAEFDHDQDAGGGRLIPTQSVEQFAAPLGRWFGLGENDLANALPRLSNFGEGVQFLS
ncbi:hypothetical protein A3709_04470 [Halioglobus sp. HI00S01]|uniref:DUF1501 domain-containing protein n=1 Tax=Halioglobus sp. HI00S01 TaxID=1822214 RepID=UPI0007C35E40|nr:DUF1501 domain-containing protein [Halioglobus sp. HI00S01]KZX57031.1 hypothetical protein A3709_04470 [Halioglobus sp. HI00S01]